MVGVQEYTKKDESLFSDLNPCDQVNRSNLPRELGCALLTFEEFWEDRPIDKNPAREQDINAFIKGEMGNHTSDAALDRIRTISRPETEKGGGAPRSDVPTYKGKSKENI